MWDVASDRKWAIVIAVAGWMVKRRKRVRDMGEAAVVASAVAMQKHVMVVDMGMDMAMGKQ